LHSEYICCTSKESFLNITALYRKNKIRNKIVAIIVGNKHPSITVDNIEIKYCLICIAFNDLIFANLMPKKHIINNAIVFDSIIKIRA
jgi:hypothetical protein